MFKKKNKWLRFGCFLTGYNFNLLMSCSETSKKSVKKYTAAMLIIMIIWLLIGVLFAKEYLRLSLIGSVITGLILMIIIIQIERQIILGNKNKITTIFRIVLGVTMALLGSIIMDQMIFKEDILKEKRLGINYEINKILPQRIEEINTQIKELDTLLNKKERERDRLIIEVNKKPTLRLPSYETKKSPKKILINGIEKDTIITTRTSKIISIPNPKTSSIPKLAKEIEKYLSKKSELHDRITSVREKIEGEILNSKGFLDELKIMKNILITSSASLIVWGLWMFFFLLIELLVVFSKVFEKENDYERIIKHQMEVRIAAINKITKTN